MKTKSTYSVIVQISMSPRQASILDALAKREGLTRSELLRSLVRDASKGAAHA